MGKIPGSEVAMATPEPSSWLSLKVFFLRVSRCEVNESMLDSLTVTHAPLTPDTVLEVNGGSVVSNGHVSLRLNRAGGVGAAVSEGGDSCTFVSTADVRVSGSVRFEVQCGGERFLVGILDTRDAGGGGWVMKCQVAAQRGSGLLRRGSKETKPPVVEVYVAGLARGAPVVFTRAMQLRFRRRRHVKAFMEPIPEHGEPAEDAKETLPPKHETEVSEYRCYKPEQDAGDADYDGFYMKPAGEEDDDGGDFSWFSAGVRVGVGISVGICLGIGIGAGLLARSYHSTSRSLRSRLISSLF